MVLGTMFRKVLANAIKTFLAEYKNDPLNK